ncbi:MAG: hypothetical protein WBC00_06810, partial [Candidatus Omnitrophota bacterium]
MEFPKEQIDLLGAIVKDLSLAIKNSVLYASDHSLCVSSVNNFKNSLEKWFESNDSLDLGVTQDDIFISGTSMQKDKKKKDERYMEVADYLHMRGIISIVFLKGIGVEELHNLFQFIKHDRKTVRKKGGVLKNIPETPHLKIKEIDYSNLLRSAREKVTSKEDEVWNFLFNLAEQTGGGELPESKAEFFINFLKDTKGSANVLNKVYREAVDSLQDEEQGEEIRDTISKICVYFEKYSATEARDIKIKLMEVIGQLHPDLINILFEKTVVDDKNFDLADTITKDFSDSFIAEFIESLISSEDTFNENLLKVFDKLSPDASRASNVVSMVADKLFSKRILSPETLTKLQMSIKDIFSSHPDSTFMDQMHKITVDAVINKKIDTLVYVARLSPMINKFVQSLEEENLKKEEIWLLLNILWLESSPEDFRKFSQKLTDIFPELLDLKDTERLKEILEFFVNKLRPEQKEDARMLAEVKEATAKITNKETRDKIVSFIPEASRDDLENITYMLTSAEEASAPLLVDAFVADKNPAHRNNFKIVFSKIKDQIVQETLDRLEYCDPAVVRDLFEILKEFDPEKTQLVAKKLLAHSNAQIRWEALEVYNPATEEEIENIFTIFKKDKNAEVRKKVAAVILKSRNEEAIGNLFGHVER